jgi:sugar lactone lactonase YvrE
MEKKIMRQTMTARLSLIAIALGMSAAMTARAQTYTPPAVSTGSQTTLVTGLTQTQAVAVDPAGDIFYSQPAAAAPSLMEQPANGSTPITLYTEVLGGGEYPKGVAATSTFAYLSSYSGNLWQVPVGGGTATDILTACSNLDAGYLGTITIAVDGSGNVYTSGDNETNIFKITPSGTCSIVSGATLAADNNQYIGADAAGDLVYATDNVLYILPAGSSTPTMVATYPSITGLSSDSFGNAFVTMGSSIVEVPFVNGTLDSALAFTVVPSGSADSVGVGVDGSIYTTDGTNIYRNFTGSVRFTATAVGTASTAQTVTAMFNSAETLTSITAVSGNGTSTEIANTGNGNCAINTPYTAGSTCTVTLTFTPAGIGLRRGAVVFSSAGGVVGSVTVTGQGSGPGLVVDPGTQTALASGFTAPDGVAVGSSGAVFVADKSAGTVSYIPAGSSTATVIATGLSSPSGVAVDGGGDVYVANTGANDVVSVPFTNGAYGAATPAVSGLTSPTAVAVGPNGSLYIANTGAETVLRVPNQGGTLNVLDKATVGSGFTAPDGIALDVSGNVYISDASEGTITEAGVSTSAAIVTGLTSPGAIGIDDSGTLYVIQSGVNSVLSIPFANGAYDTNSTTKLGSGFTTPASLAVDSAGDVYVADEGAPAVVAIQRSAGLLNLGNVNEGDSSAEESLILSNDGDLSLTFGSPLYTGTGDTGDFTIDTSASGTCAASGALSAGNSCDIGVTFTPATTSTYTESLTLSSNAANASPITATLTGTGVNEVATTTTLSLVSPASGPVSYGEPVTVAAAVAPVAGATGTPTGTVQFFVNGVAYGNPVNLTNDSASTTITGLPAANNSISVTYSGDNNFAGSTSNTLTVNVALAASTTVLVSSISSATAVPPGTSVTLTATVSSSISGITPTGTVTFTGDGTTLGVMPVSTTGVATLTTTTLPTGSYSIVATYSGDSGFAGSTSNAVPVAVLTAGYQVSGAPTALTVAAPGSVSTTFTVTPISGYTGGIDMACSGLPANTQCSFTPGVLTFLANGSGGVAPTSQVVTLTLTTEQAPPMTVAWVFPLGGLLLLGGWRARKRLTGSRMVVACVALLGFAVMLLPLSGCGNASPKTPAGASTVTVTLTGTPSGATGAVPTSGVGNMVQTFSFSLNVQ